MMKNSETKKKQKKARSVGHTPGLLWLELFSEANAPINPTLTGRLPYDIMGFRGKSRKGQTGKNHWAASRANKWIVLLSCVCTCTAFRRCFAYLFGFRSCYTADRRLSLCFSTPSRINSCP
jgi:hypothetical protein